MRAKKLLVTSLTLTCLLCPTASIAAEYQLRLESKEAYNGYLSLQIFRTRKACNQAKAEYEAENPGRKVSCHRLKESR